MRQTGKRRNPRAVLPALALCVAAATVTLPARAQASHGAATAGQNQAGPGQAGAGQTEHIHAEQSQAGPIPGGRQRGVGKPGGPPEQIDAPETEQQHNAYVFAKPTKWIAKKVGLSVGTTATIFQWVNSGILLFVIFYFLFKALPGIFRRRRERLARDLVEARRMSDEAERRLAAIEERLSHLDEEIEAFQKRAEEEAADEERRMHETLEEERKRIVHSAEQEIGAAGAMAQRNLRRYAAELAVGQVRSGLKVDVMRDRALVAEFSKSLHGNGKGEPS